MDDVEVNTPDPRSLIRIGDLRASLGQIIRTEFPDDSSAIVLVRIGEHVYTRGLRGEALTDFLRDISRCALDEPGSRAEGSGSWGGATKMSQRRETNSTE